MSLPTLCVIGTDADGRVVDFVPCSRGIEQALAYILLRLRTDADDPLSLATAFVGHWRWIAELHPGDEEARYQAAVFVRPQCKIRYGLALLPAAPSGPEEVAS